MAVFVKSIFEKVSEDLYSAIGGVQKLLDQPPIRGVRSAGTVVSGGYGAFNKINAIGDGIRQLSEVQGVTEAVGTGTQLVIDGVGLVSTGNTVLTVLNQMDVISVPGEVSKTLEGVVLVGTVVSGGHSALKKIHAIGDGIRQLSEVRSRAQAVGVGTQLVIDGARLLSNGTTVLTALDRMKVISISSEASKILRGVGLVGTVISEGYGVIKKIQTIASKISYLALSEEKEARESRKTILSLICLITSVILVAAAVLGMTSLLTVFYVKLWILGLTLLTLLLVCSLSAYLYEQSRAFEPSQV